MKRGGDVTYHGPGQLVGYPIVSVSNSMGAADHVCAIQRVIVASLGELGVADVGCLDEYPGVWVGVSGPNPRKICAIGVRLAHGRTMHGFALNVAPDMRYMRDYIVPCGIADKPVTSLHEEGVGASLEEVAEVVARQAGEVWGAGSIERQDVAWKHRPDDLSAFSRGDGPGAVVRRLAQVGVSDGLADHDAQARLAAPQGRPRPRGDRSQEDGARSRTGHRVRGGRLPEPQRLLGRRHRHVHGARRTVHAGLRLLPRRHAANHWLPTTTSRPGWPRPLPEWVSPTPC